MTAEAGDFKFGSVGAFDDSWKALPASERYHFAAGEPAHQVQFAFQNHWRVFQKVMGHTRGGRAIELGCGRGSMAAFFAKAGFETHLLDTSASALDCARRNFEADGLTGHYHQADALATPFPDDHFDVAVSIGLLEHFEDIAPPLEEQIRILKPGGVFLGYVVPERPVSVQTLGAPLNAALRLWDRYTSSETRPAAPPKQELYRNTFDSTAYLDVLDRLAVKNRGAFGMFPVPLVSHSWKFPFTAMSPAAEKRLMATWRALLAARPGKDAASPDPLRDPWTCAEPWGLAFLVWARK